jgi:hypothetical protein
MKLVSVSTDKQQTFSMIIGDYISGRAEKNAFINKPVQLSDKNKDLVSRVLYDCVGRNIRLRLRTNSFTSRVEARSNTSTVALRVVGGDEKRSLDSEVVTYRDSDQRMTSLARTSSNFKRQIRPRVRENVPHQHTHNRLVVIKIWS